MGEVVNCPGCARTQGSLASSVHDPVPVVTQYTSPDLIPDFVAGNRRVESDPRWTQSGAPTSTEYAFWARRSCGPACLLMVLGHLRAASPSIYTVVKECEYVAAYVVNGDQVGGIYYAPFAKYMRIRHDLDATVHAGLSMDDLTSRLADGALAIVSVHKDIRYGAAAVRPRRGGHLVLAYGATSGMINFNNPSGHTAAARRATMALADFERFYAGRGILIQP